MKSVFLAGLGVALCAWPSFGTTVRLVYGKNWQRAGRDVAKTLQSQAWKSLAKSAYQVELVDEEDRPDNSKNLGSRKLPCIFVLDDRSRCYCVIDNVPYQASAEWIFRQVSRVTAKRAEIEKKYGTDTAEGCGQLMFAMERYVGGPKRVISKGFYDDIYAKLRQLDPEDKTGWLRHFTMPFTDHEGRARTCSNSDGLEIVEEATWYRKNGKVYDGEKFVEEQRKLPAKHLTLEQKQSLLMAKFALYAPDDMNRPWTSEKKGEMTALLKRIAEAGEETLWGTAAVGWLASPAFGEPPLSTYWGWRKGDFPAGKFSTEVKYGVTHAFPLPGDYTIEFERTSGAQVTVESVTLYRGKEEVETLKPPFEVKIDRAHAGKLTKMVVHGTSGGESEGRINIARKVLKPRKEAK